MYKRQILERLNETDFVAVAKETTTAQVQCGNRRSAHQLHGTQLGTLQHSCSITAGHSAMASSRQQPTDMTFQIRAIPGSLDDDLQEWGPNKQLARMIDGIGVRDHLMELRERIHNLSITPSTSRTCGNQQPRQF